MTRVDQVIRGANGENGTAAARPVITQQPSVRGDPGEVIEMIISEVITSDHDETGPFRGLGEFVRAEPPRLETAADRAMSQLGQELRRKALLLGADAVVNVRVHSIRGVGGGGLRRLRISAVGTAVRLTGRDQAGDAA